jgi:predicted ATP-binding protein involved in virulence
MRIERLILHDVGPFKDMDISFQPCPEPGKAEVHMFVGPNGSGKSTLLYALAQIFGADLLPARFRKRKESCAAVWLGGLCTAMTSLDFEGDLQVLGIPARRDAYAGADRRGMLYFGHNIPLPFQGRNSNLAFAYAGGRTVAPEPLTAIQEPGGDPLKDAVSFHRTADSQALVQWIANTKAKEALALARGDVELARQRGRAIAHIESAVQRMIGQEIRFLLKDDPLEVKLLQNGAELGLDVLPDGLKSILAWIGDLLMRLDRIPWQDNDVDLLDRPFVLFLDEIEIHLHPAWQRKILPAVQALFPNAQIFLSTHSPFVVGSVSDAWVYPLRLVNGNAVCDEPVPSKAGESYLTILDEVFGVEQEFDIETTDMFDRFHALKKQRLTGDASVQPALEETARKLSERSDETRDIVEQEMRQLRRVLGTAA